MFDVISHHLSKSKETRRETMRIFLTGASGRVGSAIVTFAVARGHSVQGLVRNTENARKITLLGADPLIGSLEEESKLVEAATKADAVIHCAFDATVDRGQALELEIRTLKLFSTTLRDTGKILITSSGFVGLPVGKPVDEHWEYTLQTPMPSTRGQAEAYVLSLKDSGIKSYAVRLPMQTHDEHQMHIFIQWLIDMSPNLGGIPYLEDGSNLWTCGHTKDVAKAFVLTAEIAPEGGGVAIHPNSELVPAIDIAKAVGMRLGQAAVQVTVDQLKAAGNPRIGAILAANVHPDTDWTRRTLGWTPEGQSYIQELRTAAYFGGSG